MDVLGAVTAVAVAIVLGDYLRARRVQAARAGAECAARLARDAYDAGVAARSVEHQQLHLLWREQADIIRALTAQLEAARVRAEVVAARSARARAAVRAELECVLTERRRPP